MSPSAIALEAEVMLALGQHHDALAYARRALSQFEDRWGNFHRGTVPLHLLVARAALALDRFEQAQSEVALAFSLLTTSLRSDDPRFVPALRLRGEIALARKDWSAAEHDFARALALFDLGHLESYQRVALHVGRAQALANLNFSPGEEVQRELARAQEEVRDLKGAFGYEPSAQVIRERLTIDRLRTSPK